MGDPATSFSNSPDLQRASPSPARLLLASLPATRNESLDAILMHMPDWNASDFHLDPSSSKVRIAGDLRPVDQTYDDATIRFAIAGLLRPEQRNQLDQYHSVDFAVECGANRFRGHAFETSNGMSAVFRLIPSTPPTIDQLWMADSVKDVLHRLVTVKRGLVLIGGSTGSGKSTTLAAVVGELLKKPISVVTLENPPEFNLSNTKDRAGVIRQIEVGNHVGSFEAGLRNALRQDPDVIMVGELRDIEETDAALKAAETGHLVLASVHTKGVVSALDRIIQMYPSGQQNRVQIQLSQTLKGVIFQNLVQLQSDSSRRMAACEVMLEHSGISNLIRTGKPEQIPGVIQTLKNSGMILLDDALVELVSNNFISPTVAVGAANNSEQVLREMTKLNRQLA